MTTYATGFYWDRDATVFVVRTRDAGGVDVFTAYSTTTARSATGASARAAVRQLGRTR